MNKEEMMKYLMEPVGNNKLSAKDLEKLHEESLQMLKEEENKPYGERMSVRAYLDNQIMTNDEYTKFLDQKVQDHKEVSIEDTVKNYSKILLSNLGGNTDVEADINASKDMKSAKPPEKEDIREKITSLREFVKQPSSENKNSI